MTAAHPRQPTHRLGPTPLASQGVEENAWTRRAPSRDTANPSTTQGEHGIAVCIAQGAAGQGPGAPRTSLLRTGVGPAPAVDGARDAAAGAGQHRHLLHRAAARRQARRPYRRRRRHHHRLDTAVRTRLRRHPAARGDAVAHRHALPEPRGRPRRRAPVRDRHGRAVRQGRHVLPRQLRRVADQADAELRLPFRGVRRHYDVPGRGQVRAAGVRVGGAVALRTAARGRAVGDDRTDGAVCGAPRPPPSGARRPARGGDRPGVGPCRRQPDEHGHGPASPPRNARPPNTGPASRRRDGSC